MAKRTLLLINGSQVLMDITKRILERDSFSVRCALGLVGAREQLADRVPDGILLAKELPDGDGFDCLREILRSRDIPVLFLSDKPEDELAAFRNGAVDFLKKPYDFEVLKARLGIMLGVAGAARLPGEDTDADGEDDEVAGDADEADAEGSNGAGTIDRGVMPTSVTVGQTAEVTSVAGGHRADVSAAVGQSADIDSGRPQRLAAAIRAYRPFMTAACFALAVALAWMFLPGLGGGRGASDGTDISLSIGMNIEDEPVPQGSADGLIPGSAAEPIQGSAVGAEVGVAIPEVRDVVMSAGSAGVDMTLSNPAGNRCHMKFEIELRETGEILYASDTLEPGARTENVTLSRVPEPGGHAAVLVIRMYAPEDFSPVGVARMDFTITVG